MEDLKTKASELKQHITEYIKTFIDLIKAKATKSASGAIACAMVVSAFVFLLIFFLVFGFTALALWLGSLLHSMPLGFLCVAGFFLLLIILLLLLSKTIIKGLRNAVIRKVYEQKH